MRTIGIIVLGSCMAVSAAAQSVTINFNGDNKTRTYEVVVDGTSYYSNSTTATTNGTQRSIVLNNLQPGTHNLKLYRMRTTTTSTTPIRSGSAMYTKDFILRSEYNMDINVNGNGQIAFAESKVRNRGTGRNRTVTAMTTTDFNTLLQTVNSRSYQSSKLTTVRAALTTSTNYFTTDQVRQLLSTITSETSRLELAKLAYARITDPTNIEQLYTLFNYQSSRDNLDAYVTANVNNNITNRNNTAVYNNGTNTNTTTRTAISSYNYNQLLQTVTNTSVQSNRYTAIYNALNGNYTFSSAQVRGLLALINSESDRLYLAKQSYSRISDPNYFSSLYDLFPSSNARTELNAYVVSNGGTNVDVNTVTRAAISSYDYNQLLQTVTGTSVQSNRYTSIYNALNGNYTFSSAQVRQLLSLINSEADRLYLAKQSYTRISDPNYFATVYDLFPSVNARTELNAYVVSNGGVNTNVTNVYTRTPMSDATFNQILSDAQNNMFQSGKVAAVRDAFNNTNYVFTTTHIRSLLNIVTSEADRLALAKMAYARVADPTNYTVVYDMLPSQAAKKRPGLLCSQ
jgi:hypothetical protein